MSLPYKKVLNKINIKGDIMNYFLKTLIISALSLCLLNCSSNTSKQNAVAGTIVGGAAGAGLAGAAGEGTATTALIGTGVIVGALIGSTWGTPMETSDKEMAYRAIAAGKPSSWQNPKSKTSYTLIPADRFVKIHG